MFKIPPNPWEGQPLYQESENSSTQIVSRPARKLMTGGAQFDNFKKQVEELNILWKNGNYYLSISETAGGLVAFSNYAVYAHVLLMDMTKEEAAPEEAAPAPRAAESSDAAARAATNAVIPPIPEGGIAGAEGAKNAKEALTKTMQLALGYVETLQTKLNAITRGEEKGKDLEDAELCIKNTQDIIVQFKGKDCITFNQIMGLQKEKNTIKDAFIRPIIYKRLYGKLAKNLLLYGPPGTGKTLLAKASATQLQLENENVRLVFLAPTGASLKGKYVGETEKNILRAFRCASVIAENCETKSADGKEYLAVMFIDEFDSIAGDRSTDNTGLVANSVNTLLQVIDGVISFPNVVLIAATNYPWNLDAAILRRFDQQLLLDYPSFEMVRDIAMSEIRKHYFQPYWEELQKAKRKIFQMKEPCNFTCGEKGDEVEYSEIHPFFKDFLYDFKSKNVDFQALCDQLYNDKYSNSDVAKVVQLAIRQASSKALKFPFIPGSYLDTDNIGGKFNKTYVSVLTKQSNNQKVSLVTEMLLDLNQEQYANIYLDKAAYEEGGFLKAIVYNNERYFNTKLMLDLPSDFYLYDSEIADYYITRKTAKALKERKTGDNVSVTMIFSKNMKVLNMVPPNKLHIVNMCRLLEQFTRDPAKLKREAAAVDLSELISKAKAASQEKPALQRLSDIKAAFSMKSIGPTERVEATSTTEGIWFEKQINALSCGRHALNNALQGFVFDKDIPNPENEAALANPPSNINPYGLKNLMALFYAEFQRRLLEKGQYIEENPQAEAFRWRDTEHYDLQFILGAMEVAGYTPSNVIFYYKPAQGKTEIDALTDEGLEGKKMILLLPGGVGHFVSFYQKKTEPPPASGPGAAVADPDAAAPEAVAPPPPPPPAAPLPAPTYTYYLLDSVKAAPEKIGNGTLADFKSYLNTMKGNLVIFGKKEPRTPFPEVLFGNLLNPTNNNRELLSRIQSNLAAAIKKIQALPGEYPDKKIFLTDSLSQLPTQLFINNQDFDRFLIWINKANHSEFDLTKQGTELYNELVTKYETSLQPSSAGGAMVGGAVDFVDNLYKAYGLNIETDGGKSTTYTGKNIFYLDEDIKASINDNLASLKTYFKSYTYLNDLSYMIGETKAERKQQDELIDGILQGKIFKILETEEIPYTTFYIAAQFVLFGFRRMYNMSDDKEPNGKTEKQNASHEIQRLLMILDNAGVLLTDSQKGTQKKLDENEQLMRHIHDFRIRSIIERKMNEGPEKESMKTKRKAEFIYDWVRGSDGPPLKMYETQDFYDADRKNIINKQTYLNVPSFKKLINQYDTSFNILEKKYINWISAADEETKATLKTELDKLKTQLKTLEVTIETELKKNLTKEGRFSVFGVDFPFFKKEVLKGGTRKLSTVKKNKTLKGGAKGTSGLLEYHKYVKFLRDKLDEMEKKVKAGTLLEADLKQNVNLLKRFLFPEDDDEAMSKISIETIAELAIAQLETKQFNSQFFFVSKFQTNSREWRPMYYMDSRTMKDFFGANTNVDFGKLQGDKSSLFRFLLTRSVATGFLSFGDDITGIKKYPNYNIQWYNFNTYWGTKLNKAFGAVLERVIAAKAMNMINEYVADWFKGEAPSAEAPSGGPPPSGGPTPNAAPTGGPAPTAAPIGGPTPTAAPTGGPTPTAAPTGGPTPTAAPSGAPTPTAAPSGAPTPTAAPSGAPTPSAEPTPLPDVVQQAANIAAANAGSGAAAAAVQETWGQWFAGLPTKVKDYLWGQKGQAGELIVAEGLVLNRDLQNITEPTDLIGRAIGWLDKAINYNWATKLATAVGSSYFFSWLASVIFAHPIIGGIVFILFITRLIFTWGNNYYLETQDKNFSYLHAGLLATFEGKTEVFGDFSSESSLVNNLGKQLMQILYNGTQKKFKESKQAFDDPDEKNITKYARKLKELYKDSPKLQEFVGGTFSALFNVLVPYNVFFVEDIGSELGTFAQTDKGIQQAEEAILNEIDSYNNLVEGEAKTRSLINIKTKLKNLLSIKQDEYERITQLPKIIPLFNLYLTDLNLLTTAAQNELNSMKLKFKEILLYENPNKKATKQQQKEFDREKQRNLETFMLENPLFLLRLKLDRDLKNLQFTKAESAKAKANAETDAAAKATAATKMQAAKEAKEKYEYTNDAAFKALSEKAKLDNDGYLLEKFQEIYLSNRRSFGDKNFVLVDSGAISQASARTEQLINLNLPLSCLTEAISLFPSNYDNKIHDDLLAYRQNKNKFMEAFRAKQKKPA